MTVADYSDSLAFKMFLMQLCWLLFYVMALDRRLGFSEKKEISERTFSFDSNQPFGH